MTVRPRRVGRSAVSALFGLLVLAALFGGTRTAGAAEKSFSITSLTSHAVIRTDGSMTVDEMVTYDFTGGPFTIGTRSFLAADRDRITDFTASEDGRPVEVDEPSTTPTGEWEWHFASPATDEQRTFELTYTVPGAIELGRDVGELYWQFLGQDHPGVGAVQVTIDVPGNPPLAASDTPDDDASVMRAWAHGPTNGTVRLTPGEVVLDVSGVPAKQFVEARLAIPASVFVGAGAPGDARLATIIGQEGHLIDAMANDHGRSYEPPPSTLARLLGPLGGAIGLVGVGGLWSKFGREPKPDPTIGDYWREPLTDAPAVVLANMAKGTVSLGNSIGSTIIDLAQRGYLTIREEHVSRLGPDKTIVHLSRTPEADGDLAGFERDLLGYVFASGPETTTDAVTAKASADQTAAVAFTKRFQAGITSEFEARGYNQKDFRGAGWIAGLVVVVAGLGALGLVLGTSLGWAGIAAAPVIGIAGITLLRNRSQTGADEVARAKALKHYLEDFSNLKDAPAGHLILWERFLVYAVTFGVAAKLLQGLAARLPTVINDPSYGIWYASAGQHRFDSIDTIPASFGAAAASAMTPSKSGSGGGFSGGGGGGGGGGGFGAR